MQATLNIGSHLRRVKQPLSRSILAQRLQQCTDCSLASRHIIRAWPLAQGPSGRCGLRLTPHGRLLQFYHGL
jgi:hypothetical protein